MSARNNQLGFTIVELLVVIVVIAVLTSIIAVTYTGMVERGQATTVKSDLTNAKKSLMMASVDTGAYPADLASAGLQSSAGTTYQYTYTSATNSYCLTAINGNSAYMVSSSDPTSTAGVCAGHTGPSAPGGSEAVVTTLAGTGVAGYVDGAGTSAQFRYPYGVAVDSAGNVYVADANNQCIRKITPAGVVSTLAGSGVNGFANGTGTSAQFSGPTDVAVDSAGNVYVADAGNYRIRKITPAGVVSTFAGTGVSGYADGAGTSAQFGYPMGIAVDSAGNVYTADYYVPRVRKITSAGVVSTLAGTGVSGYADGAGTSAQFRYPRSLAVDSSGNVYIAEAGNHRIRKITPAGVVSTFAGTGVAGFADGAGASAQFSGSQGIAVDSAGNVYVGDYGNNRIRKITSAGVVSTMAGTGVQGFADGAGTSAQFNLPNGVAVDSAGNVYVADWNGSRIRKIQP